MNHSADCSLAHSHLYLLILTLEFLEKIYAYVCCPGPQFSFLSPSVSLLDFSSLGIPLTLCFFLVENFLDF